MKILKCPHCGVDLFVSSHRAPKCGKCGGSLSLPRTTFLQRLLTLFQRSSEGVVSVRPNRKHIATEPIGSNLKAKIDRLTAGAWGNAEYIRGRLLILAPLSLNGLRDDEVVTAMLAHVRAIAPGLNVPLLTPRLAVESMAIAAGMFVEQDGWVKIVVDNKFFENRSGAWAILCHELCHYVLNASGVREPNTLENERLTDAAMFVFGLGDIFLMGYQRMAGANYRTGHRLGYLSDDEYRFCASYVDTCRRLPELFKSHRTELEERFRTVVPDAERWERLLQLERNRHPLGSEPELIERALESLARDNR